MSLFGPFSSVILDEAYVPFMQRAFQRAKKVGSFAVVQAVVQLIGFGSGILLVRNLSQHDYAYFTIANTMQATIQVLADIGISVGLMSIGGHVWHDRTRFGSLINTAFSVRKKLGIVAIVAVAPFLYSMLARNGAPFAYIGILIFLIVAGISIQFSQSVLAVVPR